MALRPYLLAATIALLPVAAHADTMVSSDSFSAEVQETSSNGAAQIESAEVTPVAADTSLVGIQSPPGSILAVGPVVDVIAPPGSVVPEPSTLVLLGTGMFGAWASRRRRRL